MYRENYILNDFWLIKMLMRHSPYTIYSFIKDDDELLERFDGSRESPFFLCNSKDEKKLIFDIRRKSFTYRENNTDEIIKSLKEKLETEEERLENFNYDVIDGIIEGSHRKRQDYLVDIDEINLMILILENCWMKSERYLGLLGDSMDELMDD
jgi:uncharacterized protein (DUF488 family)